MTVLSDNTIRDHIKRGELILHGNVANAEHCSYHVTGRILIRGSSSSDL
jgi:hypothetical protein